MKMNEHIYKIVLTQTINKLDVEVGERVSIKVRLYWTSLRIRTDDFTKYLYFY